MNLYVSYLTYNSRMTTTTSLSNILDYQPKHNYTNDALGQLSLDNKLFWKKAKYLVL